MPILNLFEMAASFRRDRIISPEVFTSWMVWLFELAERSVSNDQGQASLSVAWATGQSDVIDAVELFVEAVTPSYISFGELQDGRAIDPYLWSPNLRSILAREFTEATLGERANKQHWLALARMYGQVIGLANVRIDRPSSGAFATLDDLVIAESSRGSGVGSNLLSWIVAQIQLEGITRMFLESGIRNVEAHSFFEKRGFRTVSKVMFADVSS